MQPNLDKVRLQAKDLAKTPPRSPRVTLGGYVMAARTLDKCRASLVGSAGEYHFDCPFDNMWFPFAGINGPQFKEYVATGASDDEVDAWLRKNGAQRPRIELIRWNNQMRERRLSELPDGVQEYMEDYIPKYVPRNRRVYTFFDVYDHEEAHL